MEIHANCLSNGEITWPEADTAGSSAERGCSCLESERFLITNVFLFVYFFAKHWTGCFLLLMDFLLLSVSLLFPFRARPGFLCPFLIHCNAFSSYTIFIGGDWPSQSWSLDRNVTLLKKKKKERERRGRALWQKQNNLITQTLLQEDREKEEHGYDLWEILDVMKHSGDYWNMTVCSGHDGKHQKENHPIRLHIIKAGLILKPFPRTLFCFHNQPFL